MSPAPKLTSAAGLLSLLDEETPSLVTHALTSLQAVVDSLWLEVSTALNRLEIIYETGSSKDKQLAASILSRVHWHLGNQNDALEFALGAGEGVWAFEKEGAKDEYLECIVGTCIDQYITLQNAKEKPKTEDARLKNIIETIFQRCLDDKEYKQAIGLALDSKRLDILQKAFKLSKDSSLLEYVLDAVAMGGEGGGKKEAEWRELVLNLLVSLFSTLVTPDYFSITRCFVLLSNSKSSSELLLKLLSSSASDILIAYQIAFDLSSTGSQDFISDIRTSLSASSTYSVDPEDMERIQKILTGEVSTELQLEFLVRNNKADLLILKNIRLSLEARNSVYHSAMSFANAFAHCGTTSDQFLRDNLDWLARASNWSKFTATTALGVIHRGNLKGAMDVLRPYLPSADGGAPGAGGGSEYSEGGAAFALGLVHANHPEPEVTGFLLRVLRSFVQNPTIQHGAALGLGVAHVSSGAWDIYEELKNVLFTDDAVAGEAAGYAMGLVMLGKGGISGEDDEEGKVVKEMLGYARETQHEKIIRGLAMGLAMVWYGKREEAEPMIETLMGEKDPILRYGGIWTVALAYAGTGDNGAIKRLLHVAVSDVNDDVRRAAVTSLGFLLFRNPSQVPRVVQLLSESYNPHVRYGASLALGIACAGTGMEDAISLLFPMTKDPVDYVRQGACIALAMVLIQRNDTLPTYNTARATFTKIIKDKHEDPMAKFGAAISQGLIDAGGRNVTISLQSKTGSLNMQAVVGMAMFCQFWYWFPLGHMISLAFSPTAVIGVDRELRVPQFEFTSNINPSAFAYPPPTKPPTKEAVEKVATAVLSTTAKAQARAKAKEKEKEKDAMDTDDKDTKLAEKDDTMKIDEPEEKKEKKEEPSSETLQNLSRVTPGQLPHIQFSKASRFIPVQAVFSSSSSTEAGSREGFYTIKSAGVLVVRDTKPEDPVEFMDLQATRAGEVVEQRTSAGSSDPDAVLLQGEIAPTPEPFQYDFST